MNVIQENHIQQNVQREKSYKRKTNLSRKDFFQYFGVLHGTLTFWDVNPFSFP